MRARRRFQETLQGPFDRTALQGFRMRKAPSAVGRTASRPSDRKTRPEGREAAPTGDVQLGRPDGQWRRRPSGGARRRVQASAQGALDDKKARHRWRAVILVEHRGVEPLTS